MSGDVKIVRLRPGWFKDKITVEAVTPCSKSFDSFLGSRKFYMNQGTRIRTKVPKDSVDLDATYSFSSIIDTSNAWDFSWRWGY